MLVLTGQHGISLELMEMVMSAHRKYHENTSTVCEHSPNMFHRKTVQSSKAKYTMPTSSKGPTLKLGVFSTEDEVTMASVSDYKQNGSTDISEKPKFVTMYDDRVVKSNLHLPRACRSMPVIDVPNIPTNMTSTKFSSEVSSFVLHLL